MDLNNTAKQLFVNYENYYAPELDYRRFKQFLYVRLMKKYIENKFFDIQLLGKSYENREIYSIKCGNPNGKKVLIWSQMHGNESSGTLTIFDIFNFLYAKDDMFSEMRDKILSNTMLYFVPRLNPDGAEYFERRNGQGIDLNRDATRLVAPESKLLYNLRQEINPELGLNLHDQDIYYSAGKAGNPTAMAFLSPAYNQEKEINDTRKCAMHIIGETAEALQQIIPGKIARYDDEYTSNAFGETFTRLGTPTILIESGSVPIDGERQYIRKVNFVAILSTLYKFATLNPQEINIDKYFALPLNVKKNAYDLKISNLGIKSDKGDYTIDVGIKRYKYNHEDFADYYNTQRVENIGDLSDYSGISTFDATGWFLDGDYNDLFITRKADFAIVNQKGEKIFVYKLY